MADYRAEARRAAQRYGLDPNVFLRQIKQESGFNPHARSPAGAIGIAQIMPATARGWGVNPNDPVASLNAAAKNMARYVKQYGSYRNALVAYNAGPGRVGRSLPAETQNYIRVILGGRDPGRLSSSRRTTPGPRRSSGASRGSPGSPGRAERIRTITETTPGVDNRVARAALIQSFLEDHNSDPVDFAVQANALKDIAPTSTSRTIRTPGIPATAARSGRSGRSGRARASFSTPKLQSGVANFEGKKVAAWIAPALQYGRRHGWKGTVNSGFRSFADQQRIYNSGVRPAAKPGTSNHEGTDFPRGAVDVSDAQTLARILARSPYGGRLKWAGAKDPVHFSHPHNGSY